MTAPIRVGVIGANPDQSWASKSHLPALQALPQFKLMAVSTTRQETANQAAQRFGAPLAFRNHHDLVTHPDVDMVTVAVKVPQHHELVLAALSAGKHVYCEWPLGNGVDQTVEMADLARRQKVRTAIGLQGRASPWVNAVRDLIASGTLGRILSTSVVASAGMTGPATTARSSYMLDRRNGATMLAISFGHLIDTVLYCLGEATELSSLMATQRTQIKVTDTNESLPMSASDQIIVNGLFGSGGVMSLHMRGGVSRGTNLLWEINGSEGDLVVTADTPFVHFGPLHLKLGRGSTAPLESIPVVDDVPDVPAQLKGSPAFNVACLYARFASDIREGTQLCVSFDDAVRRHQLLHTIEQSDSLGKRLRVAE
jgi:predicted dehydrogenase